MVHVDAARRFLVDLRRTDVTTQHVAWQGALHALARQMWGPQPCYLPRHGQRHPSVRGKGHYMPFRVFSNVFSLNKMPASTTGQAAFGGPGIRHTATLTGDAVPVYSHGQVIWLRVPSPVNLVLIGPPPDRTREPS